MRELMPSSCKKHKQLSKSRRKSGNRIAHMTEKQKPSADSTPSFEAALEQLQNTVKGLESGELSLEQALKSFEEGVRLTRTCQEQLSAAEQRVELLTRISSEGRAETEPFSPPRG